jgi:1-deoxy-D-xylulose-5-phosphate reductoisomerase
LNAANEVAVEAFLQDQIRFDQIHAVNLGTLESLPTTAPQSLDDLLELDARSREKARGIVGRLRN